MIITGEAGLDDFFRTKTGRLDWPKVKERMELIPEDHWSMQDLPGTYFRGL